MSALPSALINELSFLRHILDSTQLGVAIFEPITDEQGQVIDFNFVYVNNRIREMYGGALPADLPRPVSYLQLFPSAKSRGLYDEYLKVLHTGQPYQRSELAYAWDGIDGWFDLVVSRYENRLVLITSDVTSVKQMQLVLKHQTSELVTLNQELMRSNQELLEFSYVASHDLQEPLRKIQQFGDMMIDIYAAQLGNHGTDLLNRMKNASVRMSALINDLLDYSRLTRQPDTFRKNNLNDIIDTVLTALEVVIGETNARIEVAPMAEVKCDASQLNQLFQNLLTNAIKFTRPGESPHVIIHSRTVQAHELPVEFTPISARPTYHLIEVQDNGIGFDQAYADQIFGAFQRLHNRTEYPGTGIGLAIAKKVVLNHGGFIKATGNPGQGAVFSIYLPI
ncbi:sensor histidine kinase [Spirosoma sordidisoli]|uniref:histidine kinase n=1 Tax=Spirosoma sordidisoli TaxID=2502893 RepID=A0A4V1RVL7_9BACT|nr:ATP-binding protein [Spirosoma sordidisoli]RYC67080.1 two-component sensor histidine kinase [Spirosoma sordidisoli]RYC67208.1 two-component sensor histidine kinase [Spirosoma sordidisoli]